MLEARVVSSIHEVGRAAWDRCLPDRLEGFDYLSAVEAAGLPGFAWRYVLVECSGTLVAAAPGFLTDDALDTTLNAAGRRLVAAARRLAPRAFTVRLAALGLVNQYLAVETAHALAGRRFGLGWLAAAVRTPWAQAWIGCEIVTLGVWMVVLSQLKLSSAFPMTALGYVLVVGLGWTVFAEPVSWPQILGGAAIVGVWLLGDPETHP